MALTLTEISRKVDRLKRLSQDRDNRMTEILAVREGNMETVYPDMFPEGLSKPMVANFVDIVARDLSELLAPLPSFNCSTMKLNNDTAKKKADKRTLIANNYIYNSRLESQMYYGADWYLSYALMPIIVEADFDNQMPFPRVENPIGSYPEYNRMGRLVSFTKIYNKSLGEILVDYPEHEAILTRNSAPEFVNYDTKIQMAWYHDKEQTVLFLPDHENLLLERAKNPIGRMQVVCPRRPSINPDNPRGQFDDVLWVQIARARFSMLALEAVEKSVQAPLTVPTDVDDFAFGPDAVIRTNVPQGVRRVGLELPTGAFTEQQVLANEMRLGSRYPEGRSGTLDANIITGQGVQALLGSFDTQVKAAQQIFQQAFEEVISICFEMDEKLFPGKKSSKGIYNGAPYELSYDPTADIAGDYTVQARYGLMSGLDPSRALIFSLQALQAGLVSKDFIMRELPWSMNVAAEQERIDVEKMRDTLALSMSALAQAVPTMASTGQGDPLDLVTKIAQAIKARQEGKPIEEAVVELFTPEPAPEPTAGVAAPVEQVPQAATPTGEAGVAPEGAPPAGTPNPMDILAQLGA